MLTNPEIKIKNIEGVISEIKILEKPKFGKVMKLKTLSPILVRKPVEENTKLKGKELYPTDKEFTERLISNLMKKFYYFYGIDEAEKRNQKLSIKFLWESLLWKVIKIL
jgi:CRISPR-associated endoribonuclease Cas6